MGNPCMGSGNGFQESRSLKPPSRLFTPNDTKETAGLPAIHTEVPAPAETYSEACLRPSLIEDRRIDGSQRGPWLEVLDQFHEAFSAAQIAR